MSDSLRPHGLQHTRLPCPSLSPRVCSNSCPLSWYCHPTTSSSATPFLLLPSIFPSSRVFSSELALHIRWPKYRSFSFSISPSNELAPHIRWPKYRSFTFSISSPNEYSGLISLRIDWCDLLAIQGTLKLISFKC